MYIENNYLCFDDEILKPRKITGHTFVQLIGLDPFNKIGDAILQLVGLKPKEIIDPFYTKRGSLAEKIVQKFYSRKYQITLNEPGIYDSFPNDRVHGGIYDMLISNELENTVVEVKSKSLNKYDYIVENIPTNEILQGYYYAKVLHYDYFYMVWIFFDSVLEEEIKNNKTPSTFMNIKLLEKKYNNTKIEKLLGENLIEKALKVYKEYYIKKKIPLDLISNKLLQRLNIKGKQNDNNN